MDRDSAYLVAFWTGVGALILFALLGCTTPQQSSTYIVGDSTLMLAQTHYPLENSHGYPGAAPTDFDIPADVHRVLWVFVWSNPGARGWPGLTDDFQAIADACSWRRQCTLAFQGVFPNLDEAMHEEFPDFPVCDLTKFPIARPDGVHPDDAGAWVLGSEIAQCALHP